MDNTCDLAFADVPETVPDPFLEMFYKYMQDPNENKVNLGVGTYRDENEKPYIFPVVK